MANLTITVGDEVLEKARLRALEQGTSGNALLREYLENYAGIRDRQIQAAQRILELLEHTGGRSGGRSWRRDDLHDRRL
jgi:hypothetical protein